MREGGPKKHKRLAALSAECGFIFIITAGFDSAHYIFITASGCNLGKDVSTETFSKRLEPINLTIFWGMNFSAEAMNEPLRARNSGQ